MAPNPTTRLALLVLFWVSLSVSAAFAQVGIGTNSPRPRAALELRDTTRGFLPPRLTNVQRDALAPLLGTADAGLLIYSLTDSMFQHWNGVRWDTGGGGADNLWGRYAQRYVGLQDHSDSVSIGAPIPTEKLHVHGNLRANGFLKLGNNPPQGGLADITYESYTSNDPFTLGWSQNGPISPCTQGEWIYSPGLGAIMVNNITNSPHYAELTSSSYYIPSNYIDPYATFLVNVPFGVGMHLDFEVSVNNGPFQRVPDTALNFTRNNTPLDCSGQPTQPAYHQQGFLLVILNLSSMNINPGSNVVFRLVGRGDGGIFGNIIMYSFQLSGYVAEPGGVYANSATFSNLQGVGTRMVVADPQGSLSFQTIPNIPPATWSRLGNELTPDNNSNVSIGINTQNGINANLHLVGNALVEGYQNVTDFLNIGGTPINPSVSILVAENFVFNPFNYGYSQTNVCGSSQFVWDGVNQRINYDVIDDSHDYLNFPAFNLYINQPNYRATFGLNTGSDLEWDGFLIEASINGGPFQNVAPFSSGIAVQSSLALCGIFSAAESFSGTGIGTLTVDLSAMGAGYNDAVAFRISAGGDQTFSSNLSINEFRIIGGDSPATGSLTAVSGKFGSLSGVGTRMVVADADGNLGTQAIPVSGPGSPFQENSGIITQINTSHKVLFGTTGTPAANVEFWDGFGDNMSVVGNDANIGFAPSVGGTPTARIGVVNTPNAFFLGTAPGDLVIAQAGTGRILFGTLTSAKLEITNSGILKLGAYTGSGTRNLVVDATGEVGVAVAGGLTGSGTAAFVPLWNTSTELTNSILRQLGDSTLTINQPSPPTNRALNVATSTQQYGIVVNNTAPHSAGPKGILASVTGASPGNPAYAMEAFVQSSSSTPRSAGLFASNNNFSGEQFGVHANTISTDSGAAAVYAENLGGFGVGAAVYGRVNFGDDMKAIYGKAFSGYGGYFEGKGYFSGNVGIGALPTLIDRLFVNGTIRSGFNINADNDINANNRVTANNATINNLGGFGTRMVTVDNLGNLSAAPLPASGALPLVGEVVAYHVTSGFPQVIPPNTLVSLRSENELQDFLGVYNDTVFTVPAGVSRIRVNAQVGFVFPTGSGTIEFYLERNDNPNQLSAYASCWAKSNIYETANISTGLISVSPGETFKLKVRHNASSNLTVSWGTFFSSGIQIEMYGNP